MDTFFIPRTGVLRGQHTKKRLVIEIEDQELSSCLWNEFGFKDFRESQLSIIRSILSGNDCFVLMATGSGKSLCYQIPSIVLRRRGIVATTVVISPLISLMEDQVAALLQVCALGYVAIEFKI